MFAREIAKAIPKQVRQVITLGAPFRQTDTNGTAPAVMRLFEMATGEKADDLKRQLGDISRPAPVPSTAIYSRTDGIANWKSRTSPNGARLEIRFSNRSRAACEVNARTTGRPSERPMP